MSGQPPESGWRVRSDGHSASGDHTRPVPVTAGANRPEDTTAEIPAVVVPAPATVGPTTQPTPTTGPTYRYPYPVGGTAPGAAAPPPPPPPTAAPPVPAGPARRKGPLLITAAAIVVAGLIGAATIAAVASSDGDQADVAADPAPSTPPDPVDPEAGIPTDDPAPAPTADPVLPEDPAAPEDSAPSVEPETEADIEVESTPPPTEDVPEDDGGLFDFPWGVAATMPDVVCLNLNEAQDEIWDAGVLFATTNDATGEGRFQLIGSNWVVVDQQPAPGSEFGEFEAVLDVVKVDEPHSC